MEAALWTEKYRPRTLAEIRDQEEIVSRLKEFVKNRTMPHSLFAGPLAQERPRLLYALHGTFSARYTGTSSWN